MKSFTEYYHSDGHTVSLATESDSDELIELINHAFSYQDHIKGEKRINDESLAKKMRETDLYVWRNKEAIVACCYIDSQSDRVHFGLLCVVDELRGTGFAQQILQTIDAYTLALGNHIVELDYMSLSPWLKRYYEKSGYKETGEVEDIGWCTLIRMHKVV